MTRQQAIINFRKMWKWMADKTRETGHICTKRDYFSAFNLATIRNNCYLCEYSDEVDNKTCCENCPIDWKNEGPVEYACEQTYYHEYMRLLDIARCRYTERGDYEYQELLGDYIAMCEIIANLPEREEADD